MIPNRNHKIGPYGAISRTCLNIKCDEIPNNFIYYTTLHHLDSDALQYYI